MFDFRKLFLGAALMMSALLFGFGQAFATDMVVTKTPWCGCCASWIEHMRHSGIDVSVLEEEDLNPLKNKLGIAPKHQSCHTGEVDGYFIEGHVPAADVLRLLAERPDAKGLSVPGMPVGSPGMEMGSRKDPYDVLLIKNDGTTEVFSSH